MRSSRPRKAPRYRTVTRMKGFLVVTLMLLAMPAHAHAGPDGMHDALIPMAILAWPFLAALWSKYISPIVHVQAHKKGLKVDERK